MLSYSQSAYLLGRPLPQKIVCANCGSILYNGMELEIPSEIIQRHSGLCPQCRKKLDFESEKLKIVPAEKSK
jgi:DNA-directed RNA polymerase subunit RPC12/RpoP